MSGRYARLRGAAVITIATAMVMAIAPAAHADHPTTSVEPTVVPRNPTCIQVMEDPDARELKVEPVESGTYTDGTLVVEVTVHGDNNELFDWTSNRIVLGVVAKGGPDGNFYDYRPNGETSDVDLHSPTNPNHGRPFGLSHISFCYLPAPGTELTLQSVSPSMPVIVYEGDTIEFVVRETNVGDFTLTNVHVTVEGFPGACDPANVASLAPGAHADFDCEVTAGDSDFTIDVRGHGTHNGLDVTWCEDPTDPPAGVFCDQRERVTIPVQVINPATELSLDAAASDGLTIHAGESVTLVLDETNTGDVTLTNVHLTTDPAGACASLTPASVASLAAGATATFTCETGPIAATTTITFFGHGTDPIGNDVTWCEDPTDPPAGVLCDQDEIEEVTITVINPSTDLSVTSISPASAVEVGSTVTIEVTEKNDGDVTLTNVHVTTDPVGVCDSLTPASVTLDAGEEQVFTCVINSLTEDTNITFFGHGTDPLGFVVRWCSESELADPPTGVLCDQDEIAFAQLTVFEVGEGCTPGFWKNHPNAWPAGINPGDALEDFFNVNAHFPGLGDNTLIEALDFGGGPGALGGARTLLRTAVAALLNAAHPDVNYKYTQAQVVTMTNDALATGDRQTMLTLAADFDAANNEGCPID